MKGVWETSLVDILLVGGLSRVSNMCRKVAIRDAVRRKQCDVDRKGVDFLIAVIAINFSRWAVKAGWLAVAAGRQGADELPSFLASQTP